MHQIHLHRRMGPRKILLLSQKLFIYTVIAGQISAQIPASFFSNADYTSTFQKKKSLFWHLCMSSFREFPATQRPQLTAAAFFFSVFIFLIFRALQDLLIFFQQLNYYKYYKEFNNVWSILSEATSQALYITDSQCFHLEHRANAQDDENWIHWTFLYVLCYDRLISDIK